MTNDSRTAAEIIRILGLTPRPEGGNYRETFRDPACDADGRSRSTAIYFLLAAGEASHWHRVDAVETWFWHTAATLLLSLSADGSATDERRLGTSVGAGEAPQIVIPEGHWQAARTLGDWTLVSFTVAPGFTFDGFGLAPPDWSPGER
jgi:predicted cupin superfamily sugar epimerase